MEKKNLKELTIENLKKELNKLENQKESDEYINVLKTLKFVENNDNQNWNIEFVKKGQYWNPNFNKSKSVWFKVFNHKAIIYIKYWKNNYLQKINLGEIK